jgi:hypothetical protein
MDVQGMLEQDLAFIPSPSVSVAFKWAYMSVPYRSEKNFFGYIAMT